MSPEDFLKAFLEIRQEEADFKKADAKRFNYITFFALGCCIFCAFLFGFLDFFFK